MKSPFPGMDPYLESHWRDVHHSFLTYARDALQEYLPGDLRARLEERVFVEPDFDDARPEQATEGYIEIIDVGSGNRVVTVVELLSESNKYPGDGQSQYLRKQREYLLGGVSLVEIDLLRSGKRVLAVPARWVPPSHRTTYQICVVRGWKPAAYEVYRAPLREPLPSIRVPLRQQDADVPLDLQMLIDRCYHHGRYDDIDYRAAPTPPLTPDEESWAHELLVRLGLRSVSPSED
jgi:hypothetical protein